MTTAEIFVLFYSQEGIKNTLTFVVKVLIILLVSKFTNHNRIFYFFFLRNTDLNPELAMLRIFKIPTLVVDSKIEYTISDDNIFLSTMFG